MAESGINPNFDNRKIESGIKLHDETLEDIKKILNELLDKTVSGEVIIPSADRAKLQKIIDKIS